MARRDRGAAAYCMRGLTLQFPHGAPSLGARSTPTITMSTSERTEPELTLSILWRFDGYNAAPVRLNFSFA